MKKTAEPTDRAHHLSPRGGLDQGFDLFHKGIRTINIDTRIPITDFLPHMNSQRGLGLYTGPALIGAE
jgi:hypothetical protein